MNKRERTVPAHDNPIIAALRRSFPVGGSVTFDVDRPPDHVLDLSAAFAFPGNPLLCCWKSNSKFATRTREEWRGELAALQLIVPSPMTARTGRTQEGKQSAHALENTGPRRFLVLEQDKGTIDEQAAVLLHLAARAPLALAVHSGSKSIHGWFYCAGQTEERLERFMRYAVSLGADRATWTRSQFVRMPDGLREKGKRLPDGKREKDKRQTVYFFNPGAIKS